MPVVTDPWIKSRGFAEFLCDRPETLLLIAAIKIALVRFPLRISNPEFPTSRMFLDDGVMGDKETKWTRETR
ncbi:hypothetical protein WA1_35525 [Scytonema hofmannii PCC 7110]|uniref:Uncharacterized protein n=1 Tax=Scytonema hofmannii PCC 7110 TaxID=128403 RepID=A0A139X1J3_9CYAN|nr:hypothetical protein WA1_35525 [Scytonema hofmannii PCC 7110]